jgi:hypothetical protein
MRYGLQIIGFDAVSRSMEDSMNDHHCALNGEKDAVDMRLPTGEQNAKIESQFGSFIGFRRRFWRPR